MYYLVSARWWAQQTRSRLRRSRTKRRRKKKRQDEEFSNDSDSEKLNVLNYRGVNWSVMFSNSESVKNILRFTVAIIWQPRYRTQCQIKACYWTIISGFSSCQNSTTWHVGSSGGLKRRREIHRISRWSIVLVDSAALEANEEYGRLVYENKE